MSRSRCVVTTAVLLSALGLVVTAGAQSPAFTYQGSLSDSGSPANGTYDFQFKLFDAASGGVQQGSTFCVDGVQVTAGLFTVQLDFGVAVFDGGDRWLEIGVRADNTPANCSVGVYTTLTTRQPVTATPYALQTRGLFVDNTERVGIGTTNPQAKLNLASGDFRIDDGLIFVNSAGAPVYQMLSTGAGVADAFFNKTSGQFAAAAGTSNDGSGFVDLYDNQSHTVVAELDADIDQNGGNGVGVGGLFLRSVGTGGPGGAITVQNNDGQNTFTAVGGGSSDTATVSLLNANGHTTVRLTGDINGQGGELRTNDQSGNSQCIMQPDFNGGGEFVTWTRNTGSNGLVFDGNAGGSGNPTLSLSSSVSPVSFNTNATGNAAVVLPNDAIASAEILDEPGVANNHAGSTGLTASPAALISRSITVPAAGYVLAFAQGDLQISHTTGTASNCQYGVSMSSSSLPTDQDVQTLLPSVLPSGTYDFSASAHGLFVVNAAGTYTFYFVGNRVVGSSATMFDIQLTLAYFPTAYGSTVSNFVGEADAGVSGGKAGNDNNDVGAPLTAEEIAAEQAEAVAFHQARLERELAQMRAQMAQMQAHLEQVEREQALMGQPAPTVPVRSSVTSLNIDAR